jgi:hypothetical protein
MGAVRDRITHVAALAESIECKAALTNPDFKCGRCGLSKVRVIVCDMNIPSTSCAKIICSDLLTEIQRRRQPDHSDIILSPSELANLKISSATGCEGYGVIVLTLKLQKHPKEKHINFAFESAHSILATRGCFDFKLVHAAANSLNERTLVCKYPLEIR